MKCKHPLPLSGLPQSIISWKYAKPKVAYQTLQWGCKLTEQHHFLVLYVKPCYGLTAKLVVSPQN